MEERLTRRGSLARFGGFFVALIGVGKWGELLGGGSARGAVRCVLTPEQTEGPYYIPREKVRRNITEGRPGVPLTLLLGVVDASTCRPIKGAAVDIWHCDGRGVYSGVQGNRGTFLRGIQKTNARGIATFRTIYPGWYPGRTVHIHVKVHLCGRVVHTGQLYFPEAVTDAAYRRKPYSSRPGRDTRNANDSVFRNGGQRSLLALRKIRNGYSASLTMGVSRS